MNRDEIIRMAREAGMRSTFVCTDPNACPDDDECCHKNVPEGLHGRPETIERFAELVAATEREACAKVGREAAESTFYDVGGTVEAAIRARGQE